MSFLKEESRTLRYDYLLIAVTLLLTLFGLVTLYSASYLFALNQPGRFSHGWDPLTGNLAACVLMIAIFPILALAKLEWLKKGWVIALVVMVTFILNVFPFFPPFRRSSDTAMRWITLGNGVGFQPSELMKIVLPLYLAYILTKNKDKLDSFVYGPLPPVVVTGLFCMLVVFQSNFSDAALVAFTGMVICFVAGIRLRWFVIALMFIVPIAYKLIISDKGIRYERIIDFMQNLESPPEARTQIDFSIEAIKSGGFWGKGIGQGTVKIIMPEVHGDFVFASLAEESGFLGVLIYFILIGVFAAISYMIAWRSKDRFIQILSFGLVTPIIVQTLLNIAVVARTVPTTGVPLPFVSSGGSSLLVTLISAALLVNMSRRYIKSKGTRGQYVG